MVILIICPNCNASLSDSAHFCTECGTAINAERGSDPAQNATPNPPSATKVIRHAKANFISYALGALEGLKTLVKPLIIPAIILIAGLVGFRLYNARAVDNSAKARNGIYANAEGTAEVVINGDKCYLTLRESKSSRPIYYWFEIDTNHPRINISAISNGETSYRPKDFGQKESYRYQISFSSGYQAININFNRIEADITGATKPFNFNNILSLVGLGSDRLERTGDGSQAKQRSKEIDAFFNKKQED